MVVYDFTRGRRSRRSRNNNNPYANIGRQHIVPNYRVAAQRRMRRLFPSGIQSHYNTWHAYTRYPGRRERVRRRFWTYPFARAV